VPAIRAAAEVTGGQDLEQVDMRWGFIPGSHKGPINEFRIREARLHTRPETVMGWSIVI
jgi:hypothetical protein